MLFCQKRVTFYWGVFLDFSKKNKTGLCVVKTSATVVKLLIPLIGGHVSS